MTPRGGALAVAVLLILPAAATTAGASPTDWVESDDGDVVVHTPAPLRDHLEDRSPPLPFWWLACPRLQAMDGSGVVGCDGIRLSELRDISVRGLYRDQADGAGYGCGVAAHTVLETLGAEEAPRDDGDPEDIHWYTGYACTSAEEGLHGVDDALGSLIDGASAQGDDRGAAVDDHGVRVQRRGGGDPVRTREDRTGGPFSLLGLGDGVGRVTSPRGALDHPWALTLLTAAGVAAALVILYRRLSRDEILDNDVRAGIVRRVREDPGANASRLADDLDVALNTVIYHVRILEETGHVAVRRTGRGLRIFPPDRLDAATRDLLALLGHPKRRELFKTVLREPGIHLAEAARRLDVHEDTVRYHADRLVEAGVMEDRNGGRTRKLQVRDDARHRWVQARR